VLPLHYVTEMGTAKLVTRFGVIRYNERFGLLDAIDSTDNVETFKNKQVLQWAKQICLPTYSSGRTLRILGKT